MNTKSIDSAIAIMTRHMEAQLPLDMTTWQGHNAQGKFGAALEEEHLCGTPCCFAGYIAVSPEFHADGGGCEINSGTPLINDHYDADAIREWFDCSTKQACSLCDITHRRVAYPNVAIRGDIEFPDIIAALTSLRDTGRLPGE